MRSAHAELLEAEMILRAPAARFIAIRSSREQTRTGRPSVSAAISSSGANIRLAAQVGLELRGDTAEPHARKVSRTCAEWRIGSGSPAPRASAP